MAGTIFWSDNWYIEDGQAWCINGERGMIFHMDLELNECEYITEIPDPCPDKFRLNSLCMKIENEIFCMPDTGDSIWIYNLKDTHFSKIDIENPNKDRIRVTDFWRFENKLFILAKGLKKIIEIDIEKKVIDNCYIICETEEIEGNVRVDSAVYCVSAASNKIYQFDLKTKESVVYTVPEVDGGLYAISYDGCQFWLSGYRKEIYVWNKESNSVKILRSFPEQFGYYDLENNRENLLDHKTGIYDLPAFTAIKPLGKYVWFIPFRTNKMIYVDKDTYEISVLEIENEIETESTLKSRSLSYKYILEYIRDNRYLGVFSLKNNYMMEIDTSEKKVEIKKYVMRDQCLQEMLRAYDGYTLYENDAWDRQIFESILLGKNVIENKNMRTDNAGLNIYKTIN